MVNSIFRPLSVLYGAVSETRNLMFDTGLLKSVKADCPVISIGNLTMGGTGKTPLVDWTADWFERNGRRPLILSRGYRGRYKGIERVRADIEDAAELYGDEPVLLAKRHPRTPVFVSRRRSEAACQLSVQERPDVIVLDDGFQHRRLRRDFDLVVIDTAAGALDLEMFPWGRARERVASLARASAVVLTKVNLAPKVEVERLKKLLPVSLPFAEARYEIEGFEARDGRTRRGPEMGSVLAVSAIGNPASFSASLEQAGVRVADRISFRDHHSFAAQDYAHIQEKLRSSGADAIVVTEKDSVKMKSFRGDLWIARLKIIFESGEETLHENFRRLLS